MNRFCEVSFARSLKINECFSIQLEKVGNCQQDPSPQYLSKW